MISRLILLFLLLTLTPGLASGAPLERCVGKLGRPGSYDRDIVSSDWGRTYLLYVPPQYDSTVPTPLVLNFHGFGHDGDYQEDYTAMSQKADEENFIVAYPDGMSSSWNAGFCCPPASVYNLEDVQFALDVVEALSEEYCIDPDRIYATGSSNGGMLSHRLACEAGDVFAAIGAASAYIAVDDCAPVRPMPVIQTQGTLDPIVPYWTAKASNDFWVRNNGCGENIPVYKKGGATCYEFQECLEGATVEFCEVRGMGHTWPNDEEPVDWIDATDMFWDFFVKHPMATN